MLSDLTPRAWLSDVSSACGLLTRLPVLGARDAWNAARATRVYPLVGALVGLIGGGVYWLCQLVALPSLPSALIAVAATVLVTGAFHEDGLADTADGLGGGTDKTRKLEIMRDSRVGSFGVTALILSVGLRAAAVAALAVAGSVTLGLIAAHAVARGLLPAIMALLPLAQGGGLAGGVGRPALHHALTALGFAAIVAFAALGFGGGLIALLAAAVAAGIVALLARVQIGGYTGDVLGAAEQAAEITVLRAAVAML